MNQQRKISSQKFINHYFSVLFSSNSLLIVIIIAIVGFVLTLKNRYIYIDDAWFGEQAYWLAKDGVVKVESLKGFFGWDERLMVYHKLNIFLGAGIIKLFGWSVNYFRIATLIIFLLFFVILRRYKQLNANKFDNNDFLLWVFYLVVNPIIISLAFTYRPEILVMLFGFFSWINLDKSAEKTKNFDYLFSGIFAGLAFLTHMNGLIFPVAGAILLLINRNYKSFFVFSAAAGITSLLYFYDLWQAGRFELFLFQMNNWPDPVGGNWLSKGPLGFLWNVVVKLSMEHQRFFWSTKVWMVSVFFLLSLIPFFKQLIAERKPLLIYTFILIVSLNVLGSQIAERFLIYFLPYMALIFSFGIKKLLQQDRFFIKLLFCIAFMLQIGFSAAMVVQIVQKNQDFVALHADALLQIKAQNEIVLADYPFVFNGIQTNRMVTFKLFEYLEVTEKMKFNTQTFAERAYSLGIAYIIFPARKDRIENNDYSSLFLQAQEIPHYEHFLEADGYYFYRLQKLTTEDIGD
ncbi:MAG: hypothetical protein CVT92_00530 [Bacteroidetes bacterium HGW-Bacteroidetes-1]|jgi:hypothetical protein|nr:MAG: hypothetical protein CVT92_00530 [Bacteroidetes bacterium HGW-Bacteroidetes-1]